MSREDVRDGSEAGYLVKWELKSPEQEREKCGISSVL